MDADPGAEKHPRKLVVAFGFARHINDLIETDRGDRPQLVHHQYSIKPPSRLVRFATILGLAKGNKSLMDAVAKAYTFVTDNYRRGDQVVLASYSRDMMYRDLGPTAAKILAKHLYDGTCPRDLSSVQSRNEGVPSVRIPIHCVAALEYEPMKGISEWNNELKSRFPPGIEHIVCCCYDENYQSCATRYDVDGSTISKEICIARNDHGYELERNSTKHIIYYDERYLGRWDRHEPAWTQDLDSSASEAHGTISSAASRPVGMYWHELRNYQGLLGIEGDGSMLVWKSWRNTDERQLGRALKSTIVT